MENILLKIGAGITAVMVTIAGFLGFTPKSDILKLQNDVIITFENYEYIMNQYKLAQETMEERIDVLEDDIYALSRLGATIPTVVALFETTLASKITSSATSMTLTSGTDKSGDSLSGYLCFVIDEGSASEEFVCGTASGTSVSSMIRGIDPVDGDEEVSSLKKEHRRGASVKISNYPQLGIISRIINGDETLPNKLTYASQPTISSDQDLATKKYADDLAIAGAPDITTSVKGIAELATTAETLIGTSTGSTGAFLVVPNSLFNQTSSAANLVPVTDTDGKLGQDFIDLTEAWSFTGAVTTDALTASVLTVTTSTFNNAMTLNSSLTLSGGNIVMGDNSITGIDTLTFTDTAGTIAGIQNQNLVDKTASETISGLFDFDTSVPTISAGNPSADNEIVRKVYLDTRVDDALDTPTSITVTDSQLASSAGFAMVKAGYGSAAGDVIGYISANCAAISTAVAHDYIHETYHDRGGFLLVVPKDYCWIVTRSDTGIDLSGYWVPLK